MKIIIYCNVLPSFFLIFTNFSLDASLASMYKSLNYLLSIFPAALRTCFVSVLRCHLVQSKWLRYATYTHSYLIRNKYASPDRALFCYKALNEVTRARKKCRVKPEPQTSVSPDFEFLSALDTLSQGCFTSFMRKFYLNLLKNGARKSTCLLQHANNNNIRTTKRLITFTEFTKHNNSLKIQRSDCSVCIQQVCFPLKRKFGKSVN